MHVTSCTINPSTGCPGSSVTVTVKVQPDYFDVGTYDVRIYGKFGSQAWSQIARKDGWANPVGGEFTLTATVTIPTNATVAYFVGAKDFGEPTPTNPHYYQSVSLPQLTSGTASVNKTSGPAPLTVQFTYTGGYDVHNVRWEFGDGRSVTGLPSVSHTYNTPGQYLPLAYPIDRCGKQGYLRDLPWITVRSTDCSNPYGTNGSYSCSGTTRIRCDAGTWKPIEYNSPQCGYQPPRNCSNPTGIHGGYGCVGTNRSKCLDGTWYTVEYNSPQCGGGGQPNPAQGCTNPVGASGDVICQGTTRVQCNGTQWVVVEENSPQCGYQPPPGYDNCSSPTGLHGTYRCSGTTRMQCYDGYWIAIEYNSPQCSVNDPPDPEPTSDDNTLVVVGVGVIAAIGIGALWARKTGRI